ncbi:uncharacterized protein [Miscanthus floridulus]|uniref:uncharacterized protein n=1 Tax=Miscanthus floridulus TaxID=154761 RepID=UPI003459DB2A
MPNFSKPFVIETDASGTGGLSTYEKEYLAILMAVEQWRSYLQLAEFHILMDHKSLVQLEDQRLHTSWQQKVFTKLLGLQYRIVYKKGVDNGAADALSRASVLQCVAMSIYQPEWLLEMLQSYTNDPVTQELLAKLSNSSVSSPHYTLQDGLIHYKGRIWVGKDAAARFKLAKPDRSKLPGLLQPLPVPERSWKVLSLDFVEGLPMSEGYNCILVVVNLFSKYAHFLSLRHPFTTATVPSTSFLRSIAFMPVTNIAGWLHDREMMSELIRQHLLRAKQRMKQAADSNRSERQFQVDDWVFLKLQPYVQASVANRSSQKLAFKYFGPYKVLARVGSVAYKLELPPSSMIHPVFHVSQLKKAVGPQHTENVSSAVAAPAARRDTSTATRQQETDIVIPLPPRWRGRCRDEDDLTWKAAVGEAATCGGGHIGVEGRTRAARREERAGACLLVFIFLMKKKPPKKKGKHRDMRRRSLADVFSIWAVHMPHRNFGSRDADAMQLGCVPQVTAFYPTTDAENWGFMYM